MAWSPSLSRRHRGGVSVIVSDTFTRADSAVTLGSAETGQSWSALAGTWGISSNQAKLVTDAGGNQNAAVVDSGRADNFTVSAKVAVTGTVRLVWRCSDVNNGFMLLVLSPNVVMYRQQAGTYNQIGTVAQAVANNDVLSVQVRGNTHAALLNGATIIAPVTDAFNNTATKHGIGETSNTGDRLDNFLVTVP